MFLFLTCKTTGDWEVGCMKLLAAGEAIARILTVYNMKQKAEAMLSSNQ